MAARIVWRLAHEQADRIPSAEHELDERLVDDRDVAIVLDLALGERSSRHDRLIEGLEVVRADARAPDPRHIARLLRAGGDLRLALCRYAGDRHRMPRYLPQREEDRA